MFVSSSKIPGTAQEWPAILGSIYFLYHNMVSFKVCNSNTQPRWEGMEMQRISFLRTKSRSGLDVQIEIKIGVTSAGRCSLEMLCKKNFQGKPACTLAPEIKHNDGN